MAALDGITCTPRAALEFVVRQVGVEVDTSWHAPVLQQHAETPYHLDAVGCLGARHGMILSPTLQSILCHATSEEFAYSHFVETDLGAHMHAIYDGTGLNGTSLTTTGSLLGMFTANLRTSRPTNIQEWCG